MIYKISIISAILFLLVLSSCKKEKNKNEMTFVYKFMDIQTYSASITEDMFWHFGDIELAKINTHLNFESLKADIMNMKVIEKGLSENFYYAFVSNKSSDTIYASLTENLWTIKSNGNFKYFIDKNEDLKQTLLNYSSFFSDCW